MKFLKRHWRSRTIVLLAMGALVSLAMWGLESTQWAAELNEVGVGQNEGQGQGGPPAALRMILPFVKVFIFLALPASLVIGIRTLTRKLKRQFSG